MIAVTVGFYIILVVVVAVLGLVLGGIAAARSRRRGGGAARRPRRRPRRGPRQRRPWPRRRRPRRPRQRRSRRRPPPGVEAPPSYRSRLGGVRGLFSGAVSALRSGRIDAATWDSLEEALIRADVGVATTTALLEELRAKVDAKEIKGGADLSALEDATAVSLDTLPPGEAAGLLARLAGRAGLSPADPAVAELTRLCGYLPLAIGMVARQLHHHPAWTAAGRAAELASARDRLQLMATENLSVAAAFNLSYADLTGDQQRLFRRLGLHPGADIDGYAAAALDSTDLAVARRGLEALYDQYLLTQPAQGRYRLHDLIREHARALAGRLDPDRDRDAAVARLLDYYQHAAALAAALIAGQAPLAPAAADGTIPAAVPDLADREQALAWAPAERASLLACLDHATATGQHARVIALTVGLAGLLRRDGPWADAITRHTAAIQAAWHLGDRLGQANALSDLGDVRQLTSEYPAAAQALEQALGIYRLVHAGTVKHTRRPAFGRRVQ